MILVLVALAVKAIKMGLLAYLALLLLIQMELK